MKTLKNTIAKVENGKLTITADIIEQDFNNLLTTRTTHMHFHPEHVHHARHIQSSNAAVFIRSPRGGVFVSNDDLVHIASIIEPSISFAPIFNKSSKPCSVSVISELPVSYQWQISDNAFPEGTYPPPVAVWEDIKDATESILDEKRIEIGKWIRCIATNATGKTISQPAKKT